MHWHGFLQTGTNQMDGVPGVTQCPIAPNATMTYTFRAELYGTAWYHTHYSGKAQDICCLLSRGNVV
jgi:FtsP/CotA-like multicopper oxidase with cupredoxin domain